MGEDAAPPSVSAPGRRRSGGHRREALSLRIGDALRLARWCRHAAFPVAAAGLFIGVCSLLLLSAVLVDAARGRAEWSLVALVGAIGLACGAGGGLLILGRIRIEEGLARDRARVFTGLACCVLGTGLVLAPPVVGAAWTLLQHPGTAGELLALSPCVLLPAVPGVLGLWAILAHAGLYRALGRPWQRGGADVPRA